jgi:hypothetical protein
MRPLLLSWQRLNSREFRGGFLMPELSFFLMHRIWASKKSEMNIIPRKEMNMTKNNKKRA